MSQNQTEIGFRLVGIKTDQFAIFDAHYQEQGATQFYWDVSFQSILEKRIVIVLMKFIFAQEDKPFLILQASCHFELEEKSWNNSFKIDDSHYRISRAFATHLAVLTLGTSRGIMHGKTEGTIFNNFPIPILDLRAVIQSDVELFAEGQKEIQPA